MKIKQHEFQSRKCSEAMSAVPVHLPIKVIKKILIVGLLSIGT